MINGKLFRGARLFLGAVALFFAGVIYAWATLKIPFAADGNGMHWANALKLNYTLTIAFFAIGGLVSGLIAKKISGKIRMIISAVLLCGGFVLTSFCGAGTQWLLLLGYGFMAGTGIGIVYNVVISKTNAWYPDKKGLCSGILMMSFGLGSFLIQQILKTAMNGSGWRTAYITLGIVIGAVILVSGFFIRTPNAAEELAIGKELAKASAVVSKKHISKKTGKKVAKRKSTEEFYVAPPVAEPVKTEYTAGEMLRRPSFYKMFIFFTLLTAVGATAISMSTNICSTIDAGADIVLFAGFVSICNSIGRLVSGSVFDHFGIRKTQFITSAVAIAAPLVTLVAILCSSLTLAVLGLCLCGFSYGFSPTVSAALSSDFFGRKNFGLNFAILNLCLIPSTLVTFLSADFTVLFIILTCVSVVGLICNIFIKKA